SGKSFDACTACGNEAESNPRTSHNSAMLVMASASACCHRRRGAGLNWLAGELAAIICALFRRPAGARRPKSSYLGSRCQMGSYSTNEFKSGLKIMVANDGYAIVENEMVKPGK